MQTRHKLLLNTSMTVAERAVGRFLRAPDHPTGEGGGGEAAPAGNAPAQDAKPTADAEDFAAFERGAKEGFGDVDTPAPGADPAADEDSSQAGTDEPPADEPSGETEKKGKSAQERIDEATATAREAERRAAEAERLLQEERSKREQPKEEDAGKPRTTDEGRELLPGEPNPDDYEYGQVDAKYIADNATFQAKMEFQRQQAVQALESEFNTIETAHNSRVEAARERYPDFDEVAVQSAQGDNPKWQATPVMALAMKTSEYGPDMQYHLAKNPAESERIARLSPLEQAFQMGQLAGTFARQAKEPAVEPTKKIPGAPPPPTELTRGQGGRFQTAPDTDDFAAFDKAYGNG